MNISRVANLNHWGNLSNNLASATKRVAQTLDQVASGDRVQRMSDSPTEASTILRLDEQLNKYDQYKRQAGDANTWLRTADSALQAVTNQISEALGLVKGAQNGAVDSDGRAAIASQLEALDTYLFELASATHLDQPIFGGFGPKAVERVGGVVQFVGTTDVVQRQVGPTVVVGVGVDGSEAFGFADGDDLFTVMRDAAAAIRANDHTAMSAVYDRLNVRHTGVLTALQGVGATQNRVTDAQNRGEDMKLSLIEARSGLADVDIAQATVDLQLANDGYQAVLGAISRASQMGSLATLLR